MGDVYFYVARSERLDVGLTCPSGIKAHIKNRHVNFQNTIMSSACTEKEKAECCTVHGRSKDEDGAQ